MTEQVPKPCCEVCGIGVNADLEMKRFGTFFCSSEHMGQYVKAKKRELGILDHERHKRRRIRFGC